MIAKEELKFTIIMVLAMITWGYSWAGAKILGPYGDVSAKIFLRTSVTLPKRSPQLEKNAKTNGNNQDSQIIYKHPFFR